MGVVPVLAVPYHRADHRFQPADVGRTAQPSADDRLVARSRQLLVYQAPEYPPHFPAGPDLMAHLRLPAHIRPQHGLQHHRAYLHLHRPVPRRERHEKRRSVRAAESVSPRKNRRTRRKVRLFDFIKSVVNFNEFDFDKVVLGNSLDGDLVVLYFNRLVVYKNFTNLLHGTFSVRSLF